MYPHKRIYAIYASLLLFLLIFSGCQNSTTNLGTSAESATIQTSVVTSTTSTIGHFNYAPSVLSFASLEKMGNAMKGYELSDAVKNDPGFTAEEKVALENIQKNKGHNDLYYDIPVLQGETTFEPRPEVSLIYSSDIEKGKGVENWLGFGVSFAFTEGNYDYKLDLYGWLNYDKNPEYTSSIQGVTVSDAAESVVILLGTNGTGRVYDVYLNNRGYHARLVSNAPEEQVLTFVKAVKLGTYEYDKVA